MLIVAKVVTLNRINLNASRRTKQRLQERMKVRTAHVTDLDSILPQCFGLADWKCVLSWISDLELLRTCRHNTNPTHTLLALDHSRTINYRLYKWIGCESVHMRSVLEAASFRKGFKVDRLKAARAHSYLLLYEQIATIVEHRTIEIKSKGRSILFIPPRRHCGRRANVCPLLPPEFNIRIHLGVYKHLVQVSVN